MKRIGIAILILLAFFRLSAQNGWRQGEMEVKVFIRSADELAHFMPLHLNCDPGSPDGSVVRAYVTPQELTSLAGTGLEYKVTVPDLNLYSRTILEDGSLLGYYNFTTITALADSLAAAFPSICKKIILGTSAGGRSLAVLKISDNVNVNENEPEILFEGGIHGDEIMGPEVVIRFARDLCTGYGNNTTYTNLVNSREIWMYYLVNPDGYVSMSRYNGNGVDINRDNGYMWGAEGFSTGAFSQPESRAIRSLQNDHNPVVFTDYHGGSEVLSYPWSYKMEATADVTHINNLASVYSNSSGYASLPFGQGYNIMYQIFGSTKDNMYGNLGQVSWSIEITNDKQPPSSQIGMYYGYNLPAMTEMINRAGYGVEGIVTDSVTGSPVKATVWVDGFFPVYTDPQVGDYHKYVMPGTHTLKVKASGYKTKTVTGVSVPASGSVVTNFQLAHDPGRYAYRVISMQLPYYPTIGSYPDESYTPGVIGPPDSTTYSLGKAGWIVIDMGDTIFNGTGNDFKVWESGGTPEGYTLFVGAAMDGPWTTLGAATGTHAFDLSTSGVTKARYIKFVDDGDGSVSMADAGFDLDAIEFLTPPLVVDFSVNTSTPCFGTSVNFTDNSSGAPTTWDWAFPGGTPGSSTQQNPSNILYSTPGSYDVTLTVGNGITTETLTKTAYISVQGPPTVPSVPTGPANVCSNDTSQYTTTGSPSATQYIWALFPPEAGTTSGAWTTCDVDWSDAFTGSAWLKVKEVNACTESAFTDSLEITVTGMPIVNLGSDTMLCLGDSILLDAGNPGCTYLWSTGETTQNIYAVPGFSGDYLYWSEVTNTGSCTGFDEIILHVTVCDAIPELNAVEIRVSPNPSDGKFNISTTTRNGIYRVYDISGLQILSGDAGPSFTVDLSGKPGGLYLLQVEENGSRATTRMVLRKQ
jgi:PKD repeat protein